MSPYYAARAAHMGATTVTSRDGLAMYRLAAGMGLPRKLLGQASGIHNPELLAELSASAAHDSMVEMMQE
jgi:hypothetical protein